ncbi:hypothetical protein COHA_000238 [Chlorella ohadii]|uniref:MARVEL domain-containing protein n=1 Tax=Chlorella ohadii TaxID=2649997 RepID=A0AAD5H974_9CHLO|nr:hypothetical protein COHA_000238 [Chlorella ohadii]
MITAIVAFSTVVDYDASSRIKFVMFTGITGFVLALFFMVAYVAGVRAARGMIALILDVIWLIFWLTAAACASAVLSDGLDTSEMKASVAFSWISFFLWIGSTIISFQDTRSGGSAGPPPTAGPQIPNSSVSMCFSEINIQRASADPSSKRPSLHVPQPSGRCRAFGLVPNSFHPLGLLRLVKRECKCSQGPLATGMKFTVLYGKRVARLELPPTVTLTELSEGLAERFNLQDPTALKFRLQEGQPSVRVRDYPDATLESAGFTSGCKVRMSVSKHAAAADGGQQDSTHAAQQQQDQQQQQQQAEAPATAGDAKFVKGQPVLYRTREGTWQEAKVVDVDYSVLPFSYGIEIDGHYRETEATRLAPLPEAEAAAA